MKNIENSSPAQNGDAIDGTAASLTRSERLVLGLVFRHGALTQANITERTDLTQQSISRILNGLTENGLLETGERVASGRRGYPSATVRIAPGYTYSVGVAVMTDSVSVALADFAGNILHEQQQAFTAMPLPRIIDWLRETIETIRSRHLPGGSSLAGIGIGIPGSFIGDGIGFNTPHMLEDWAHMELEPLLAEALGLPVWAENDGNAAALGESMVGVGRWTDNFAYLHITTGVGGGVVLDGELWRGRHGNAGEFAGGLPPNIYPFPNLELLRHMASRDGWSYGTVNDMLAHFDPTWPAVDDWIARVKDSFSIIASNATAILDLDTIVLGGRLPRSLAEKLIPQIDLFDQKRRSIARPTARLVPAEAEGDAAAIGAALLPLKHRFFNAA